MRTNDTVTIFKQDFIQLTHSLTQIQKLVNQIIVSQEQWVEPEFGTPEWQAWADQQITTARSNNELITLKSQQDIDNVFN